MRNLGKHLRLMTVKALSEYRMLEAGDHVAIGLSGGKDSWSLLHVLHDIRRKAPFPFEITGVTVDYGNPGFDSETIRSYMEAKGWPFHLEKTRNAELIERHLRPGSNLCAFCARLRRGSLYAAADKVGANKIALGHHGDDLAETLLLNFFFSGKLRSMAPKIMADNGRHLLIRPFLHCHEKDIIAYTKEQGFPVVPCGCPHGGCQRVEPNRQFIKKWLAEFEATRAPHLRTTMITALQHLDTTHLLDPRFHEKGEAFASPEMD